MLRNSQCVKYFLQGFYFPQQDEITDATSACHYTKKKRSVRGSRSQMLVKHARTRREIASPGIEGGSNNVSNVHSHLKHSASAERGYVVY